MSQFNAAFEALRLSAEPWAIAPGGPRTEDLTFTDTLPIPEVDGGGVDPLVELEKMIEPRFEYIINGRDYNIAAAFIQRDMDERNDAYIYTTTFSVFV